MKISGLVLALTMVFMLAGCGDDDPITGTSGGDPPGMVTGLTVDGTGLLSVTLSWDTESSATGYVLSRSDSENGTYTEVYSGAAAGFVDDNALYARTYWYRATARNAHGSSSPCAPVSGTTATPSGFTVTGSPSGSVDYPFNYVGELNGHPRYQSDPIGLNIIVPSSGPQAGLWVINDQIEGINRYYHPTASDYPPRTGWRAVVGDTETSTLLTPFML